MYILASKSGILTGKRLARKLGLNFHTDISKLNKNNSIIIRYGNAQDSSNIKEDTESNSREAIIKCSNKHKLWKYLEDSEILTPRYFLPNEWQEIIEKGFPILARSREHKSGQDITICNSEDEIPTNTKYLVPFYNDIIREYRVHVAFNEVIKIMRKYPIDDESHPVIKTSHFGWQYKLSKLDRIKCAKSMTKTALEVAEILGLNFCGIDMAWSSRKRGLGRWIVWEVNSAPSLNSASLEIYAKLFQEKLLAGREDYEVYKSKQNNVRN